RHRKGLIEVDHQDDVVGQRAAGATNHCEILLERWPADLDLETSEARSDGLGRLVGGLPGREHPEAVVGRDGTRLAAEQRDQGHAGRYSERVPGGHVDPGDCHSLETARTEQGETPAERAVEVDGRDRMTLQRLTEPEHEIAKR